MYLKSGLYMLLSVGKFIFSQLKGNFTLQTMKNAIKNSPCWYLNVNLVHSHHLYL